ncbi:TetR/AcrR family transcriptional regulator, partial [Actinospica sp. MGRD01-02]
MSAKSDVESGSRTPAASEIEAATTPEAKGAVKATGTSEPAGTSEPSGTSEPAGTSEAAVAGVLGAAPEPVSRPLRRDAERNRQLILGAAKTVFAQRGLEASLDDVAKEAGLGVGTVYRRFPNRDALIDAMYDDMVRSIIRIVDESVALPRAWDGIVHFMTEMLESQGHDKGLRDVMLSRQNHLFAECGRHEGAHEDVIRERLEPALYDLVARAQQDGDLREDVTATDFGVLLVAAVCTVEFTAPAAPEMVGADFTGEVSTPDPYVVEPIG